MIMATSGFGAMLVFCVLAAVPTAVSAQDAEKTVDPPVQAAKTGAPEDAAVDVTLQRALERSEAGRADLERRYRELADSERRAREQVEKLAAEKESLLKGCPPKSGDAATDASTLPPVAKKKSASRSKAARKMRSDKVAAVSGEKVKTAKKKVGRGVAAKKGSGNAQVGGAPAPRKSCGAKMSLAEVKKNLQKVRNLSGMNLNGLNLSGMDLSSVNLSGACLVDADLDRANLQEANLERSDMSGANLRMASLKLANLNGATFAGAVLDGAIWADSRICLNGSVGRCRDVLP